MNVLRLSILLCIILLSFPEKLSAQKKHPGKEEQQNTQVTTIWKKRVARLVDTRDTLDEKGHVHTREYGDTTLAKLLVDAVMNEDIIAYDAYDFSRCLERQPLYDKLYSTQEKPDTLPNGKFFVATDGELYLEKFTKYKILEEWIFDPYKRETVIHIVGIDLLRDIYGDDGKYRVSGDVFWLKWEDVNNFLIQFMNTHPENNLIRYLWDDNFKYPNLSIDTSSISITNQNLNDHFTKQKSNKSKHGNHAFDQTYNPKIWSKTSLRTIEISGHLDFLDNQLTNYFEPGLCIIADLFDSIHKKKITAFNDQGDRFQNKLSPEQINFWTEVDTIEILDPISGENIMKIIHYDFDPDWFNKYTILESWSFNYLRGITRIKILGIEPRLDKTGLKFIKYENLFWVRYEDVLDILHRYDEYHPLNNLSTSLWQSYFKAAPENKK